MCGEAKGNYKLYTRLLRRLRLTIVRAMKARAKLEEQEVSSPLSALPVNIIFDMVASHLKAMAMDVRPCFKVSKLLAIDAICCGAKTYFLYLMIFTSRHM